MPDEPDVPKSAPPIAPPPTEADYDAIHAAVMETVRGRWFLAEYAKRNRHADTGLILAAIDRVAARAHEPQAASPAERVRFDLVEMAKAIAQTRSEIAAIKPDGDAKGSLSEASEELDSIVHATERATSDILAAAEQVQEIAWTLRELGADPQVCDALDRRATDIYTACSFQDLTGQRIRKVVEVLRFLEERIRAMIDIWGETGPAPAGIAAAPHLGDTREQLGQPDIDRMMPMAAEVALATAAVVAAAVATVPIATDAVVADADAPMAEVAPHVELASAAEPRLEAAEPQLELEVALEPEPVATPEPQPEAEQAAPIVAPELAAALALDQATVEAALAAESQVECAAEPVAAPEPAAEPVAALPPDPVACEVVVQAPEPQPAPVAAPEPVAEPVAAFSPEPVIAEAASVPEPHPEPEMAHAAEPVVASEPGTEPAAVLPADPVAIEAAPVSEPQPEPDVAYEAEPLAASPATPHPEAAAIPSAARSDAADMLRRILALIRPPADSVGAEAPQSESAEDGRFVATVAVSEIEDAHDGAGAAGADTPATPPAKPSVTDTAPPRTAIGRLTVDEAVSELLLRALARAASAATTVPVAAAPQAAAKAETSAPAEVPAEAVAEEPVAAAANVDEAVVEPDPVALTEAPVALDTPEHPAAPDTIAPAAASTVVAASLTPEPAPAVASAPTEQPTAEDVQEVAAAVPAPTEPASAVVLPLPQPAAPVRTEGLAAFRALSDEDKIALFS